jgi:RND family efflux transporter MFP subunit
MSLKQKLFKIGLPIIIVLLGVGVFVFLKSLKQEPQQEIGQDLGMLVEVFTVENQDWQVTVTDTGTVQAAQEISIIPQTSGEVIYVSPSMEEGGFFSKGEELFKVDSTDYQLALEQAKATEAEAELNLATIESWSRIARAEWERIKQVDEDEPNPLVVYEPQLKNAQAELASAKAAVKQAELNLERTEIRAPFNCRIRSENIDIGQYVRAGSSVAVVAGTDTAEVIVPLPLDELRWLDVPMKGSQKKGSMATIHLEINGKDYERKGKIVRSTGEVDPMSRMTKVVIELKDPYGLLHEGNARKALITGSFVNVSIRGGRLKDVFLVPRTAIRDNDSVWIMDKDDLLRIRNVQIVRYEREHVLVKDSLEDGERIVLTNIPGAADGMKLRVAQEGNNR